MTRLTTVFFTTSLVGMAIMILLTPNAVAQTPVFDRNLKVGMSGPDIRELQILLNNDVDTAVAYIGPGSSGQESEYFGQLTENAVIRFQEKYAADILWPNGLYSGTGYVGPNTIRKLNSLIYQELAVVDQTGSTEIEPLTAPKATLTPEPVPKTSPIVFPVKASNMENLDKFYEALDAVGKKKGLSDSTMQSIKSQIAKDVATTTNLKEEFIKQLEARNQIIKNPDSFLGKAEEAVRKVLARVFPQHVSAAGGVPFGGALLYAYTCTCSYNWLITVSPMPPTYPVLLTYEPFSQAFLSYNIPKTSWLLGNYSQGSPCMIYVGYYCTTLPSEGMITPATGSSPM